MKFLPWVLVLLLALTAAWLWREKRNADAAVDKAKEAAGLVADHQVVAVPISQSELDAKAEIVELKAQLAEARKVAPHTTVTQVEVAQTAPITVTAQPEPSVPQVQCVVANGDKMEIRVKQVELTTRADNQILVGNAAAWRIAPPPETEVVSGKFEQNLTSLNVVAKPSNPPGWGFGVAGFAGNHGYAPGLAVAAPPLTFWGHELDVNVAAGLGTLGVIGSASVLLRP
jgi:hypothetical protein